MFAPGAMPRLPEIAEPRSVRMSPNRFDPTMTSSVSGCVTILAASASTWYLRTRTAGTPPRPCRSPRPRTPSNTAARSTSSRSPASAAATWRRVRMLPKDPLRTMPREHGILLNGLPRRAGVESAADARVFAFAVLPHADHVDLGCATICERRRDAGQEPNRSQVHVLIEVLP